MMADVTVNHAVILYRKGVLREFMQEIEEYRLRQMVGDMTMEQLADYMKMTSEIDEAADEAQTLINQAEYAVSTATQLFRAKVNHAGLDH